MSTDAKNFKEYGVLETLPVARFFYQGTHTHPVRTTLVLIEDRPETFVGYVLRRGRQVQTLREAIRNRAVKTFSKVKIARFGDYCRLRERRDYTDPNKSTLRRCDLLDLVMNGA